MDKQNKIYEERRNGRVVKDNGDSKKLFGEVNWDRYIPPDRGDSNQNRLKTDTRKEEKHDINKDSSVRGLEKIREAKVLNAKDKKIIREKYTLKLRSLDHVNSNLSKNEINKNGRQGDYTNAEKIKNSLIVETETPKVKQSRSNSKNSGTSEKLEHETIKRKPVIKTVTSKKDTMRIFKAVTFVDQKKKPMTPLKINISTDINKKKPVEFKSQVKVTVSRVSVKEKPVLKKTGKCPKRRQLVTSPDISVARVRSPSTEIAKWAPTSINHHTKPYYEAWVDTTLTTIPKNCKDHQFLDKQIIKSFKRAFEDRPLSPEVMYEKFSDEKFTGRIKVTQR